MRKISLLLAFASFVGLAIWLSCSSEEPAPTELTNQPALVSPWDSPPGLETKEVYRQPTGQPGEYLTVTVFNAKGGGKPQPPPPPQTCTDPNNNSSFNEWLAKWAATGIEVVYNPSFEPSSVTGGIYGDAFDAIDRSFLTWEAADGNDLITLYYDDTAPLPPVRDYMNIIGWRQMTGKNSKNVLATTYMWSNNAGEMLEADIVFNTSQSWSVNTAITLGSTTCGTNFDVQAIATHEIGHFFGLDHVNASDATMAPTAGIGELQKQTLTPGEIAGINYLY
jgi:hypothetical protein